MCGITGALNLSERPPIEQETLLGMLAMIRHRGPDGFGVYLDSRIGMGSARLSIIDLAGGDQPLGNEDGSLWVVFNGEIFNYIELRAVLEAQGHTFSTHSDTEVLLHMYEEHGPAFLNQLNGQFAISLWDTKTQTLLLARDRVGVRPLFYTLQDGRLIFGSEVRAIAAFPGLSLKIDQAALAQVFTYWSVQSPGTIFEGVREIPPGHYLMARDGQVEVRRYWELDFGEDAPGRTTSSYLEELESLLLDAVRIRLRADVPVGAYLSGGLDSSLISALIRQEAPGRLDTFSIAFSDAQFDESIHQREMAEFLGTDHQVEMCDYETIGQVFPELIWHVETPILRTAPAPMFLLSRRVRQRAYKVVLTGEGADEFMAGYDIFKEMKIRRFWSRQPESSLRPLLLRRLYPEIAGVSGQSSPFLTAFFKRDLLETGSPYYSHLLRWKNSSRNLRFLASRQDMPELGMVLPEVFAGWSSLGKAQYLEISTFLSPYLLSSQGDRPAMGNSVEGRYPFLDVRLMEFAARLPAHLKMNGLTEKWLLRKLGQKYLPGSISTRRKRPYRAPIHNSFFRKGPSGNQPLDFAAELLSTEALGESCLFNPPAVSQLFGKVQQGGLVSEVEDMALVGVLSAQLVHRHFIRDFSKHIQPAGRAGKIISGRLELNPPGA